MTRMEQTVTILGDGQARTSGLYVGVKVTVELDEGNVNPSQRTVNRAYLRKVAAKAVTRAVESLPRTISAAEVE